MVQCLLTWSRTLILSYSTYSILIFIFNFMSSKVLAYMIQGHVLIGATAKLNGVAKDGH